MKALVTSLLVTTALLMLSIPVTQAEAATAWIPPGPVVGSTFPDALALQDQTGKAQTLKALLGKNGAAVFFVRSADWCPFCIKQLTEVNGLLAEFKKHGVNVVTVSLDTVDKIAAFHSKQSIGYTMLSDADGAIVEKIGIRDPQYNENSSAYRVARPMVFIVDSQLKITHKYAEASFRNRPDTNKILADLGAM
ncbi:MAG: peroxiredoxin family protein [Steroidobacteraceae bacterium]